MKQVEARGEDPTGQMKKTSTMLHSTNTDVECGMNISIKALSMQKAIQEAPTQRAVLLPSFKAQLFTTYEPWWFETV